jgi:S1-C subfamily serine protease
LKGFYLTRVYPNTTAAKAGLRPGDFIIAVDDQKLAASGTEHEEELEDLVRQYDIGTKVDLSLLRDGAPLKVAVELERSPKLRREMKKYRNEEFDFTVRDVAFFDRAEQSWNPEQTGALVEEVKSGSWAELASLYTDDLIVEVDGQPVTDVDSLKKLMDQISLNKPSAVVMKVRRGIHTAFLQFEPAWESNRSITK